MLPTLGKKTVVKKGKSFNLIPHTYFPHIRSRINDTRKTCVTQPQIEKSGLGSKDGLYMTI